MLFTMLLMISEALPAQPLSVAVPSVVVDEQTLSLDPPTESTADLEVIVGPPGSGAPVNRGLFSVVNLQRSFAEASPAAWERIEALNLRGTQVRTETMIDLLEPANDNEDPSVFAWERLHTSRMFRFLPGLTREYAAAVEKLGAVPLILLTYNVPWLARNGQPNDPPRSNEEWAEFAAAAVEHLIALHDAGEAPFPRYVEVWNEPGPGGPYWTGSVQEYAALFRVVADRIHRDYPGVQVGGPSFLADHGVHLMRFLELAGDAADFITIHVYNDDPVLMTRRLERWIDYIADTTGRDLPLMVTETDNWRLSGGEKFRYLMVRQFELLRSSAPLVGVHQFSLPYYPESPGRVFGLVRPDGSVIGPNYWPYWFFAAFEGEALEVAVEQVHPDGSRHAVGADRGLRESLPLYAAAAHQPGRTTVLLFAAGAPATVDVRVSIPATVAGNGGELSVVAVTEDGSRTVHTQQILPGTPEARIRLGVAAGVGFRIIMRGD